MIIIKVIVAGISYCICSADTANYELSYVGKQPTPKLYLNDSKTSSKH